MWWSYKDVLQHFLSPQGDHIDDVLVALMQCDIIVYDTTSSDQQVEDCLIACSGKHLAFLVKPFVTALKDKTVKLCYYGSYSGFIPELSVLKLYHSLSPP